MTDEAPSGAALMVAFVFLSGALVHSAEPAGETDVRSGRSAIQLVQSIPLPDVHGRIDHLAVDADRQRLFIAARGNNTLEIVDTKAARHVRSLPGFREPQGVAYLPESNRIVVANGDDGTVAFVDGETLKVKQSVALGSDADNVRYDAARQHVLVGYGGGGIAILDATGARRGDIRLPAHPESF